MPIDSSMYLQQQAPDILGGVMQGMKMRDMARQRDLQAKDDEFNARAQNAVTIDPATGKPVLDPAAMKDLVGINGVKALKFSNEQDQKQAQLALQRSNQARAEAEAIKEQHAVVSPMIAGLTPENFKDMRAKIIATKAFNEQEIPQTADANWIKNFQAQNVAAQKMIDDHNRSLADVEHTKAMTAHAGDYRKVTQEGARERMEDRIHDRVVTRIQKDPILSAKLNQYNNISTAISNFAAAEHPTPQQFDELQQAIRANLGIKGASAVGEREHTTMNSLGLNTDRMMQFLTGNPQDVDKNGAFAKHMQDLARLEGQNIQNQVSKRLNAMTGGHASMYERRADLKDDLLGLASGMQGQFAVPVGQSATGIPPAPHPEDNAALSWAKNNPNDPRAAKILQMNGVQ